MTDAFLDFDDEMNVKRLVVEDFRLGFSVKGEDGYESGAWRLLVGREDHGPVGVSSERVRTIAPKKRRHRQGTMKETRQATFAARCWFDMRESKTEGIWTIELGWLLVIGKGVSRVWINLRRRK